MSRTGRLLLGVLVAYVLALQGMLGAHAAARHALPLQVGVLCSGEAAPHDGAPALAHDRACDLFCGGFAGAATPPASGDAPGVRLRLAAAAEEACDRTLRPASVFSPQQPRAPPFAI